ncbi:unnamed protein product [Pleuronectes platessa]|uniref:Uncharacterized protein n=1 Tax=Pleuronectes platessa TaxID=8262 RepID=A0A9N7YVG5_PLEPL|nr:unnamed protein product [Pleuronectes platessa]
MQFEIGGDLLQGEKKSGISKGYGGKERTCSNPPPSHSVERQLCSDRQLLASHQPPRRPRAFREGKEYNRRHRGSEHVEKCMHGLVAALSERKEEGTQKERSAKSTSQDFTLRLWAHLTLAALSWWSNEAARDVSTLTPGGLQHQEQHISEEARRPDTERG